MSKICCFTGSRDIKEIDPKKIFSELEKVLIGLIENEDYIDFRAGGAVGFDTIAAFCVLELKKRYPNIKLHLMLPCKNQEKYFDAKERQFYETILERADSHIYIQEQYTDGVMFKRNRALVDGSDLCVALLLKSYGGTYHTVRYAKRKGVEVRNIANLIK